MKYQKIIAVTTSFFAALALNISCGSDDSGVTEEESTSVEEGRSLQIENLYDNQIAPLQVGHISLTEQLVVSANEFKAEPTETTLSALKNSWSEAFMWWMQMEIYNIGVVRNSFIHSQIHEWPVNQSFVEESIATETNINEDFIVSVGSSSKGYGVMEYLLYGSTDTEVLAAMTTGENAENRLNYLLAVANNLQTNAENLQELWSATESSFKERLESGVNGSQNLTVNAVIAGLETIKITKLEQVINNPASPELRLEAYYSEYSKEAILANLEALRDTYTGDFTDDGFGMEEYLVEVLDRPDLNAGILMAFENAITLFSETEESLRSFAKNDADKIVVLRDAVTEIIALLKNDYSSAASIVVTFNDNDGD
ncbi:imelysin family protein [Zobellia roscoffensis]|uniref:imelysin family protein n=1 Tax=Zobellia roscoffensis TaxID=2779508 RepID=UPI00188C4730|nr:imelysin family protein [Zobellia roscoffensis]